MRILFWSESFWPYIGGAPTSGLNLLRGLRRRGHEFLVVTRGDDPALPAEDRHEGFPIRRFPFHRSLADADVDRVVAIRREVTELRRRFAPDLVHVNCFGVSVLFALDTSRAHPAPLVLTLRGERYDAPAVPHSLLERALREADRITAPSARTAAYARDLVPGFRPDVAVIRNGVEPPPVPPEPLPTEEPRFLCLGRLVPNKGFDLAIRAFALLADRFPRARMIVAGDGPARSELERLAIRAGVGRRVDFPGWVAPGRVPSWMNRASAVVVPSRGWEALPLVALEAAYMARPVVASRDGGLPEVVVDGETGLLVDKEDVAGLSVALRFLLEHPAEAAVMGRTARRRAREEFGMERCVDAYASLYRGLRPSAARPTTAPGGGTIADGAAP